MAEKPVAEAKKEENPVETKPEVKPTEPPKPTAPTPEAKPVEPAKPELSYKAIVITDTCRFCEGIKEYLSQQGLTDKVKIINASTPEGRRFAIQHGIRGVPECVVVEGPEGKNVKVCSKEEFVKLIKEGS